MQPSVKGTRLTWRRGAFMVLAVMVITSLVAWWEPLWVRPPNFAQTDIVYAVLALAWIPAIAVVALRHPSGSRWIPALLILVGVIPVLIALGLFVRGGIIGSVTPTCNQRPIDAGQVLYTCRVSLIADSAADYVFEGPDNFPLVRLLSSSTCQNQGCDNSN